MDDPMLPDVTHHGMLEQLTRRFSWLALSIFLCCEGIGIPLTIAGGEGLANEHLRPTLIGFIGGLPLMALGFGFPFIKLSDAARDRVVRIVTYSLPVMAFGAFFYLYGLPPVQTTVASLISTWQPTQKGAPSPSAQDIAAALAPTIRTELDSLRQAITSPSPSKAGDSPKSPTANEISQAIIHDLRPLMVQGAAEQVANIQLQLTEANQRVASVTQQLQEAKRQLQVIQQANQTSKTPGLGLDDSQFWRLLRKFREGMREGEVCWIYVSYPAPNAPGYRRTGDVWADINLILYYSDWKLSQQNNRSFFAPGISLYVNSDSGPAFNCANRLADLVRSFGIEVPVHTNTFTPSLTACSNQCVDVALGQINEH